MAESSSEGKRNKPSIPHGIGSSAEVKYEDFKKAARDPEVKKFLASAKAQGEKLEQQGRIYP